MAGLLQRLDRHENAVPLLAKLVDLVACSSGEHLAEIVVSLSECLQHLGRHDEAVDYTVSTRASMVSQGYGANIGMVDLLEEQAMLLGFLHRIDEGVPLLVDAMIMLNEKGLTARSIACQTKLGKGLAILGRYRDALPYFMSSSEIACTACGERSEEHADCLKMLAECYHSLRQHEETVACMKLHLDVTEALHGTQHTDHLIALDRLIQLHEEAGAYEAAELELKG